MCNITINGPLCGDSDAKDSYSAPFSTGQGYGVNARFGALVQRSGTISKAQIYGNGGPAPATAIADVLYGAPDGSGGYLPPTSITASSRVTLTNAHVATDEALVGWTKEVEEGGYLAVQLESLEGLDGVTVVLEVTA